MADSHFDVSAANGLLKPVFEKLRDARPANPLRFTNKFGYNRDKGLGEQLQEAVWLTDEQGFTHDAGTGTVFDLNDSQAAASKKLTGSGAEIVLKSTVAIKLLAAAQKEGDAAFTSAYKGLFKNMTRSMHRRVEVQSMWADHDTGLGIVSAQTDDSGTTQTFSVTAASWAPGIWAGAENMQVEIYSADFVTNRTTSDCKVTAVTMPTGGSLGTITVTGTEAQLDNVVATDVFKFRGSETAEGIGMMKSSANAGTYLGISGATYSQWAGNTHAVGSANLTWEEIESGIALAVGKGLDQNGCLYVSPKTWGNLNTDLAALRVIDSSYRNEKTDAGTSSIVYHSQNGMVSVEPYHFMKQGYALFFPEDQDRIGRYGASDVTFEIPDRGGEYMKVLEGKNGVEFRAYTDQLVVNRAVSNCCVFSGIVNS